MAWFRGTMDHRADYAPKGRGSANTKGCWISSYRACDPTVRDRTIYGNIVVVFVDEVQPFLAGCVALDNQAKFAEKSGAVALVVGAATRLSRNVRAKSTPASIPVVILDEKQTRKLKAALATAAASGIAPRAEIQYVGVDEGAVGDRTATLRLQVFRPTLLNIALLGMMAFLVVLISAVLIMKFRWRPTAHHDLWMRALALAALKNMETRKFTKQPIFKMPSSSSKKFLSSSAQKAAGSSSKQSICSSRSRLGSMLPRFASMQSVAQTAMSGGQERCSICLDDFVDGVQLRVLFCGHEFHSACVDPWLLSKRRCPLCQFDVVAKRWPEEEQAKKNGNERKVCTPVHVVHSSLRQITVPVRYAMATPGGAMRMGVAPSSRRSRSIPRRRPLRDRNVLQLAATIGPLSTVSGYSSDLSSYPEVDL
ncbi:plr-1 [Pristionchus pacificus]|uniref:Plr-1 n=1 Tax=Pristionchus pacificus TaxID=54126 RepID=A0A2A6CDG9_PRIPA|nr:plr-1 [Pristionchus pacificus]|eukprot:PDM76140.1 plr-1 [Pristionchus pacificus]